jgi:hypothetical protein
MIRLIGDVSFFIWKKAASHHVPKVTTVLYQAHPNLALHVVDCASYYHAVTLSDCVYNVPFHFVRCMWFVLEHSFLKVGQQLEIKRG